MMPVLLVLMGALAVAVFLGSALLWWARQDDGDDQ